jgi:hypothetical protein
MAESWTTVPATDVQVGDRVRLASGLEMLVSRIEPAFLGLEGRMAFIEDTPSRWYKQPVAASADVEVSRT